MSYKFNPKNKKKLDNIDRRRSLPPKETLEKLYLKEGDYIADIGCGIGYFTFPALDIVKSKGKVYAIDISQDMLEDVEEKINNKDIDNIQVIKGEISQLKDNSVNYIFISNVLHEIDNKDEFFDDLKRVLQSNGRVSIIEWKKIKMDIGPSLEHRLSQEWVKDKLFHIGFKDIEIIDINDNLYSVTGKL